MTEHCIPPAAQSLLQQYLYLELGTAPYTHTPYYNNRRIRIRGGLRAAIGKGTPKDIIEEAKIIAHKKHTDLSTYNSMEVRQFLDQYHLGVDCSGFAYYLLDAIRSEKGMVPLRKVLRFQPTHNLLRKVLRKLRPIENTNVATFALPKNSHIITLKSAQPGDIIIICGHGAHKNEDHILCIIATNISNQGIITLTYAHSLAWDTDTNNTHGVRLGTIELPHTEMPILSGTWTEQNKTGNNNGTYTIAQEALRVEIRRLNN